MEPIKFLLAIAVVVLLGGGWYAYSLSHPGDTMKSVNESTVKEDAMMVDTSTTTDEGTMMKAPEGEMVMAKGSYETYAPEKLANAKNGSVVLFFRATWCPTCKALDADIRAHLNAIPDGVTILDVDYDKSTVLKQKYGVTYQHTLVQVDTEGNMIAKWSGSPTLIEFITHIKK